MSSGPPLPLLRLPSLVLSKILRGTSPIEVITLSLCSRKAYKRAQACRDKSIDWEIQLLGWRRPRVRLIHGELQFDVLSTFRATNDIDFSENLKIGGFKVPVKMNDGYLVTFWDDVIWNEGFRTIVNHVSNFYEKPLHSVILQWEDRWIIDWINERQTERLRDGQIENCSNATVTDEDYHKMIENFKPTRFLCLHAHPKSRFWFNGRFPNVDDIRIDYGFWVTVDNLLDMDSIHITVKSPKLKSSDMNLFLKNWLAGKNSRLKLAQIHIKKWKLKQVLHEIRAVKVRRWRQYKRPDGEIHSFVGEYDIRREDGVTATVANNTIAVWPDSDGNYD